MNTYKITFRNPTIKPVTVIAESYIDELQTKTLNFITDVPFIPVDGARTLGFETELSVDRDSVLMIQCIERDTKLPPHEHYKHNMRKREVLEQIQSKKELEAAIAHEAKSVSRKAYEDLLVKEFNDPKTSGARKATIKGQLFGGSNV